MEQNKFKPGCLTTFVHNFKECIKELAKSEQDHLRSVSVNFYPIYQGMVNKRITIFVLFLFFL